MRDLLCTRAEPPNKDFSCFNVPNSGLAERHLQPLHQRLLFSPWLACQRRYLCQPSSWWEEPQDWVAKRPMRVLKGDQERTGGPLSHPLPEVKL